MTPESSDRFGMPDEAFAQARASHGENNPAMRMGMYVPTRAQVLSSSADELADVLDLWLWESPTELIPSYDQIRDVRDLLSTRPDAAGPGVQAMIAMCEDYLSEEREM